ncbi:MAG: TIGR04283 family arsenosugar biosynthesis glycosyltransferase [Pseudomonadota bacterium]
MPAPVSIIIPTLNAANDLPACLESLLPGLAAGLVREVVLCDGGSRDATLDIGETAGCELVSSGPGRGRQLQAGATASRGEWLLFLHADTVLSPEWVERVEAHMHQAPDKAATFTLAYRSDAPEARWLARRANMRSRWFGLPYGDQGLFLRRDLYDAVGGYPNHPLMEDVAIVRAIGRHRLVLLSAEARTSAAKYERDGWRKRAYANAWLLTRYLLGASPATLAKSYS